VPRPLLGQSAGVVLFRQTLPVGRQTISQRAVNASSCGSEQIN
jgi:hypothetical protein